MLLTHTPLFLLPKGITVSMGTTVLERLSLHAYQGACLVVCTTQTTNLNMAESVSAAKIVIRLMGKAALWVIGTNTADQGLVRAAEPAAADSTQHCRNQPGVQTASGARRVCGVLQTFLHGHHLPLVQGVQPCHCTASLQ